MKKAFIQGLKYTLPALAVAGLMGSGVVSAATTWVKAQLGSSSITVDGSNINHAPKLVYENTTYVQLYGIQQALKHQGISNSWNGSNFNISSLASGAHLNAVLFSQSNGLEAYSENNGLNDLSFITYQLPIGTDTFETYIDINNIPQGNHTLKEKFYNSKGALVDTAGGTFSAPIANSDRVETTNWTEPVTSGYNSVKVFLDGAYLGYGQIVAG